MAITIAVITLGCVRSATDVCEDGRVCAEGRQCHPVAATQTNECVTPEQLLACDGKADGEPCEAGTCFSGACLPAGCNNKRVDAGEACDDGNNLPGDGCSADCRSAETCGNGFIDPVRQVDGVFVLDEQCDDGGYLGHDGCSSACEPETPRTTQIAQLPRRRVGAAMATDVRLRRIVMFGGRIGDGGGTRTTNDTWELDDDGWVELRIAVSPPPRNRHAMVADDTQIVLFGGGDVGQVLGDTWTFRGTTWSLVSSPSAPAARFDHAMAWLPGTGVVLFGGVNEKGEAFGDTWIYADETWTKFSGSAPPARSQHTLTLDPIRRVLVLTAGAGGLGAERVVDTWEFDGVAWRQVAGIESPDVISATAIFDRTHGQVLLDGGYNLSTIVNPVPVSSNTHAWNGQTWSHASTGAPGLANHASAPDPITGQMIVFGGTRPQFGAPCNDCPVVFDDTYRLEGANWFQRPFIEVPTMRGAAATLDPLRRRAVLYSPSGATYELAGGSWLLAPAIGPPARSHAAIASGRLGTSPVSILFGGATGANLRTDAMWTWNGTAWTQRTPTPMPSPRFRHAMVYDAGRDRTILVGGVTSGGTVGETWSWNGTAWSQLAGDQVTPRSEHAMAYDPIRDVVILFGGLSLGNNPLGDVWQLDASGWTMLAPQFGPAARHGASMAWDAARQRIVLFGGTPSSDTWEWDGAAWTFVNADATEARTEFPMVSSPTGAGVIAVGGALESGDLAKDTLSLSSSSGFAGYAACRSAEDDDGDLQAGCDDPDCWATCTPTCAPGTTCGPAEPRCGDGACDAPRERCGICADCPCP